MRREIGFAGLAALSILVLFQNCAGFHTVDLASTNSVESRSLNLADDVCTVSGTDPGLCGSITNAYDENLKRLPGVDEIVYWTEEINSGRASQSSMASSLASTPEAANVNQVRSTRSLLWGPIIAGIPSEKNVAPQTLGQFNAWVGKPASLAGINGWWHTSASFGSFNSSVRGWINEALSHGAIPVVMWLPMDPNHNLKCSDPAYMDYLRRFSAKSIAAGVHDVYIRSWAQQARAFGRSFYLRPFHELNSQVHTEDTCHEMTPWAADLVVKGERLNSPSDLIAAYRHVVSLFRAEGATNVKWVWSVLSWPSANFGGNNKVSMKSIYPGDEFVDWIGIECYKFSASDNTSCADIMKASYSEAAALSPTLPIHNIEMGTFEGPGKAQWVREALDLSSPNSIFNKYPRLKGFMYWEDSRINGLWLKSDPNTMAAFSSVISDPGYVAGAGGGITDSARVCTIDGVSLPHAAVLNVYQSPTDPNCNSAKKIRACDNGSMTGDSSYIYASCVPGVALNPQGSSIDAATARNIAIAIMTEVLNRTPAELAGDGAGIAYWTTRIQGGVSQDQMRAELRDSDEYFIRQAYVTYLRRAADAAGVRFFLEEIKAGRSSRSKVVADLQNICAQRVNGECS